MHPKTRIRSTAMRGLSSAWYLNFRRGNARLKRRLAREPAAVHYFHQVDDPYSHLAIQKLDQLKTAYHLGFKAHLVSGPSADYQGSSEHFDDWALRDALSVAADYGTSLHVVGRPGADAVQAANDNLAALLDQPEFAQAAFEAGQALWSGRPLADSVGDRLGDRAVGAGNALRKKLGHYLGGMFWFDGEWFWGVDRVRLLEQRLIDEGYGENAKLCVPEPAAIDSSGCDARSVVLEYFPSLRSPYTAIGHPRVIDLVARSGVTLKLRPVMPMLMRGIPAPFAKQQYIISDSGREARARNVPFGRIVDPFGEPVLRAFALFPAAMALGKGMPFVTAYLSAAWAEGIDICTDEGLRQVAANAGIDWGELQRAAQDSDWESVLDDNLSDMLDAGLWGVPSFRVSGGNDEAAFACWGQDRIWRVENEIAKRA